MIPKNLTDWTYDSIKDLIDKNICESDMHDFKYDLPNADTLTKICCSFANTKGGFVIFGIRENNKHFEIMGIEEDKEIAHKFGQKLHAMPTIYFELPKTIKIPDSDKVLIAFYIPLSPERPHISNIKEGGRLFYKRTNKGNDYMTYEEIKMSFQNYEERREKLKLLYIELLSNIEQLDSMKVEDSSKENVYSLVTLDSATINSLLTDLYTTIGQNKRLVQILFTIRERIKIINNKIKLFFSQVALPTTNQKTKVIEHNEFINKNSDALKPLIKEALEILEKEFDLKNPLT